jgi:hypothetical protein
MALPSTVSMLLSCVWCWIVIKGSQAQRAGLRLCRLAHR